MIAGLLKGAVARREPLRKATDALRLVNSAGDSIPGIVVEQYGRHVVVHRFAAASAATCDQVVEWLVSHLDPDYLVVKRRYSTGGREYDTSGAKVIVDRTGPATVVQEHGLRFGVDLAEGLSSGLFLDMRANRRLVAELAAGREVLNTFAYTCSFGVACRSAGACRVVNVDIGKAVLERGRANYDLNGIEPHEYAFVRADALRYLTGAAKRRNLFDVVIVDPPTFGRAEGRAFSVVKQMPDLLAMALAVLRPGGDLLAASNCTDTDVGRLKAMLAAAAQRVGRDVVSVKVLGQGADFPQAGGREVMAESHLACLLARVG